MADDKETVKYDFDPENFSSSVNFPASGTDIGKYENLQRIGQGGQAAVFKAYDPELERFVAVKVLTRGIRAPEDLKGRFEREIKIQARLKLPGTIPIFGCGEDKGWLYYAMEYVEGVTLDTYFSDNDLSVDEQVDILLRLTKIIAGIHKAGLRHRDIKPSNVMITNDGEVKLLDFGLVTSLDKNPGIYTTRVGEFGGTPAYMSPERSRDVMVFEEEKEKMADKDYDAAASDVYSLGVLFYELLTGRLPYTIMRETKITDLMQTIQTEAPTSPRKFNPKIPAQLEKIVMRMLDKNPKNRPDAYDCVILLEKVAHKGSALNKVLAVIAGLLIAACVGLVFVFVTRPANISGEPVKSYQELAEILADGIPKEKVPVTLGAFTYWDSDCKSVYSAFLHRRMSEELVKTGKFKIVDTGKMTPGQLIKLADAENKLADTKNKKTSKITNVDAIVRGKFHLKYPNVTIVADMFWPETGDVKTASAVIPVEKLGIEMSESMKNDPKQVASIIVPQNLKSGKRNYDQIKEESKIIPHDFEIAIFPANGRREFQEGETVSFNVVSNRNCHIAVFAHQPDGSTVLLFPNSESRDTFIPANKKVSVPGAAKSGFELEAQAPFGTDVIQVVACTKANNLYEEIRKTSKEHGVGYEVTTRGFIAKAVKKAINDDKSSGRTPEWSEANVAVSTYPKVNN